MGYGLKLISRLNDLALGISLGFVYVMDGALVGNVSVYPAGYPRAIWAKPGSWRMSRFIQIISGAASPSRLVDACLDMIRQRAGRARDSASEYRQ